MAKQLLTPLRLIARMNFSLKNYSCELFTLTGTVGKVELISTFTTVVCESWNVSDKYTWDNTGDSNLSQEMFAMDTLGAVICSLGHGRKHMLTILPTIWRPGLRRISSLGRNRSQRVSKYSPARKTIFCHRMSMNDNLMNIGLAGLSNRES